MKKLLTLIFAITMFFTLTACSNNSSNTQKEKNTASTENNQTEENNNQIQDGNTTKHILVAYFSHSGNTKVIADQIHENVGGDIFEIKPVDPYPTEYNAVVDQAKKEQEENFRPKLATKVDNIDSYDVIFIGYPNWWGTMPMPVFTFLEQYNLSGKTIVPFCTHEGSGLGRSVDDIKKTCLQSTILEGLAVRGNNVKKANKDVSDWLQKIEMLQ